MDVSIPADSENGNGDAAPEFGQALLDRALSGDAGRAALLLLDGPAVGESRLACARILRRADMAMTLSDRRLGVLAPHLRGAGGAADLAVRMLAALPAEAASTAAIGIALAPEEARDFPGLVASAERALGRAGGYRNGRFAFADAALDARHRMGPLLAEAIDEALAEDQFRLVYQPIVRLSDGAATGAEALLRWPRPGDDWRPSVFIPEAERRGLIGPITAWTFRAACRLAAARAPAGFAIGVNLSAAMLGHGAAGVVADALAETGAPPERITVEVTETAPFIDDAAAVEDVRAIKALGCGLAVDDFGAGHASLAYLVKLPVDRIKLDASLVRDFLSDARARAAVAATARLAAELGADVTAEGVAAPEVAAAVAEVGVAFGQGQLFGSPVADPFA